MCVLFAALYGYIKQYAYALTRLVAAGMIKILLSKISV
ncbi:hypothetical protein APHNP_0430 [Anaplasma phagocytophilum str. ApNP]|uniref:Uncharacterized protein n=2 Tax=Anaplasma phagocytophilum TaxID=948 RepID=A0A0F3NJB9_ANAPH|nr:hypothetical protein APHMUC_0627 [Anaplasma phagocytophilum str. ApMUC09]KJV67876.1 hypothetical protein APHNP_0430 [Anaplasma phagocytophilum str. ApNP]